MGPAALRSEARRADPNQLSEHARKVARILKASVQPCLNHTSPRVAQAFFREFDSPQENILMWRAAGALPEQFSKVVRAHPRNSRKLRQGEITG